MNALMHSKVCVISPQEFQSPLNVQLKDKALTKVQCEVELEFTYVCVQHMYEDLCTCLVLTKYSPFQYIAMILLHILAGCVPARSHDSRNARHHDHVCCCTDVLAKCKDVTDPTLAAAVDNIKETVKTCPCGLKYKQLADKIAEQTTSTGASDTCVPEMQQIIKGTVCLHRKRHARASCQKHVPISSHFDISQHTVQF